MSAEARRRARDPAEQWKGSLGWRKFGADESRGILLRALRSQQRALSCGPKDFLQLSPSRRIRPAIRRSYTPAPSVSGIDSKQRRLRHLLRLSGYNVNSNSECKVLALRSIASTTPGTIYFGTQFRHDPGRAPMPADLHHHQSQR